MDDALTYADDKRKEEMNEAIILAQIRKYAVDENGDYSQEEFDRIYESYLSAQEDEYEERMREND